MNDLTLAAIDYLNAGYHLLALTGKRPNPKYHGEWSWDNSFHGTPEEAEEFQAVIGIFGDESTTGIALLIPENILVADIDTDAAATVYTELAGALPTTAVARTRNGLHVWFVAPGAKASVWVGGRQLLFKGFGGYVVAPPSAHLDQHGVQDGTYEWITDFSEGIDFLPDGIGEAIRRAQVLDTVTKPEFEHRFTRVAFNPLRFWQDWGIDGLARAVETAADGNQNNVIHWAAMTAREEGVPFEVAQRILLAAAIAGHHPRERAIATIRGAYRRSRG